MKTLLIPTTLCALFALAACEKREVVAVPAPAPAVVTVPGPAGPSGPSGPQGEAGKTGTNTTVIVTPPASAASN